MRRSCGAPKKNRRSLNEPVVGWFIRSLPGSYVFLSASCQKQSGQRPLKKSAPGRTTKDAAQHQPQQRKAGRRCAGSGSLLPALTLVDRRRFCLLIFEKIQGGSAHCKLRSSSMQPVQPSVNACSRLNSSSLLHLSTPLSHSALFLLFSITLLLCLLAGSRSCADALPGFVIHPRQGAAL